MGYITASPGGICFGCTNNLTRGIEVRTPITAAPVLDKPALLDGPALTGYETPTGHAIEGQVPLPPIQSVDEDGKVSSLRLAVTPQVGNEAFHQGIPPNTRVIREIVDEGPALES